MRLKLQRNIVTLIDKDDFDRVSKIHWYSNGKYVVNCKRYGKRKLNKKKTILLHRFILGLSEKDKRLVDHIDRNPLNNQKKNLRICTQVENQQNRKRVQTNNKSGYRGVCWNKSLNYWVVQGTFKGKRVWCKYYKTKNEAIEGRKEFERQYFTKWEK